MDKRPDVWKKFQNEMKDKRSSKKKRKIINFLLVFFIVAYGARWS